MTARCHCWLDPLYTHLVYESNRNWVSDAPAGRVFPWTVAGGHDTPSQCRLALGLVLEGEGLFQREIMSDRLPGHKRDYLRPAGESPAPARTVGPPPAPSPAGDSSPAAAAVPRPRFVGSGGSGHGHREVVFADLEFEVAYPALWEYLTLDEVDGRPRSRSTLTLFVEDNSWKVCCADRDLDRVLFRSATAYAGLLAAVEEALGSRLPDWRASKRRRA